MGESCTFIYHYIPSNILKGIYKIYCPGWNRLTFPYCSVKYASPLGALTTPNGPIMAACNAGPVPANMYCRLPTTVLTTGTAKSKARKERREEGVEIWLEGSRPTLASCYH